MFQLSEFYSFCKTNDIDVIPYDGAPNAGATFRDDGCYAIFLDFSKIKSVRRMNGICYHESGHAGTGALHKVDSPYELVERSEYRANRWAAERYLPVEEFHEAFGAGYTELWQLAEYFNLPEEDIKNALTYWTERKGIDFSKGVYHND